MIQERPVGCLRYVMIIGLLVLFSSLWLSVWVIHQGPGQQRFFNPWAKGNRDHVVWAPLEQEKKLYTEAGYDIQWLDGEGFGVLREWLGPYAGIFEMLALRGFGLWLIALTIFWPPYSACAKGASLSMNDLSSLGTSPRLVSVFSYLWRCSARRCACCI